MVKFHKIPHNRVFAELYAENQFIFMAFCKISFTIDLPHNWKIVAGDGMPVLRLTFAVKIDIL